MVTKWVLLPVPAQDADSIEIDIAARQRKRGEPTSPSVGELSDDELASEMLRRTTFGAFIPWPESALERLAAATTETTRRWSIVMTLCAESPGTLFSTTNISERTELTIEEWRTACRHITPHLRKHYKDAPLWGPGSYEGSTEWPLVTMSGRQLKLRHELHVGITEEQAKRWLAVLNRTTQNGA
jgi:hypothetical protein